MIFVSYIKRQYAMNVIGRVNLVAGGSSQERIFPFGRDHFQTSKL